MKESNTLVGNAANNSLTRKIWLDTKEEYMKKSNTLATYAVIKQHKRAILNNTS